MNSQDSNEPVEIILKAFQMGNQIHQQFLYESCLISLLLVFSDVDSLLLRMTIVGVLLSFRSLAQEALQAVSMVNT